MTNQANAKSPTKRMMVTLPIEISDQVEKLARKNRRTYSSELAVRVIRDVEKEMAANEASA